MSNTSLRSILQFTALFLYSVSCLGQQPAMKSKYNYNAKPNIDTSDLGSWPILNNPQLSHSGKYYSYSEYFAKHQRNVLYVGNMNDTNKVAFHNVVSSYFTQEYLVVLFADSLLVVENETQKVKLASATKRIYFNAENNRFIAYSTLQNPEDIVVYDLRKGKMLTFPNALEAVLDNQGKNIIIKSTNSIKFISITDNDLITKEVPDAGQAFVSFNKNTTAAYFVTHKDNEVKGWVLNKYDFATSHISVIASHDQFSSFGELTFSSFDFTFNDDWMFLTVSKFDSVVKPIYQAKLDIWSYKDDVLPPEQKRIAGTTERNSIAVENRMVFTLDGNGKYLQLIAPTGTELRVNPSEIIGDYAVVYDTLQDFESKKPGFDKAKLILFNLRDGSKTVIHSGTEALMNFQYSPTGKYLVFWSLDSADYCLYNIANRKSFYFRANAKASFTSTDIRGVWHEPSTNFLSWLPNEEGVICRDNFDLWLISTKNRPAVNITAGYGKSNNIKFKLLEFESHNRILVEKRDYILSGYNLASKESGYFRINGLRPQVPIELFMGPVATSRSEDQIGIHAGEDIRPLKAKDANLYVVCMESEQTMPNLFQTSNFKDFVKLTSNNQNASVNWLTTELVSFRLPNGSYTQGILYKPENFDSSKLYPLIFHYYEKMSHKLHKFLYPDWIQTNIDIPLFVSNGYLVFEPDFHFSVANKSNNTTGETAVATIEAAIAKLRSRRYLNLSRIGLAGHSFGGFLTSFIISHSNFKFAAASEAAGTSDQVSSYLGLIALLAPFEHASKMEGMENGQGRYGATLWKRKDLYVRNSVVLQIDKINCPLLIMHNKLDNQVPFNQGVALFMGLKRLHKKAWMLQYDNGTHGVFDKDAEDYTLRIRQYFDYYLLGKNPPKWMTTGVHSLNQGKYAGLELDTSIRIP